MRQPSPSSDESGSSDEQSVTGFFDMEAEEDNTFPSDDTSEMESDDSSPEVTVRKDTRASRNQDVATSSKRKRDSSVFAPRKKMRVPDSSSDSDSTATTASLDDGNPEEPECQNSPPVSDSESFWDKYKNAEKGSCEHRAFQIISFKSSYHGSESSRHRFKRLLMACRDTEFQVLEKTVENTDASTVCEGVQKE